MVCVDTMRLASTEAAFSLSMGSKAVARATSSCALAASDWVKGLSVMVDMVVLLE
ncbi:hypothetical protein D3C71_1317720 [compost metagenome]